MEKHYYVHDFTGTSPITLPPPIPTGSQVMYVNDEATTTVNPISSNDYNLPPIKNIPQKPAASDSTSSSPASVNKSNGPSYDSWYEARKMSHREVERRRRETINEGIQELAKIVPGCEKKKGSIIQRAIQYINTLKENEAMNIEKWTLEKFEAEQTIQELSRANEKLKNECERAWRSANMWKQTAESLQQETPPHATATEEKDT
ncbi:transcription factor [Schizosaccharomyces japonicus yFS275]|uniref:Transcription factor n=1 Tax=Schizosaccharomyces japonicus (strain yFS275 / FY16936) TaxID=402676 RepID=B6K0E9_SCHJY|nr:transcription factor [Schizosaccharomyces japonicus yFS275]EEB06299.1 transcription factor [Schizosaccharomyces japonicus yFS275]